MKMSYYFAMDSLSVFYAVVVTVTVTLGSVCVDTFVIVANTSLVTIVCVTDTVVEVLCTIVLVYGAEMIHEQTELIFASTLSFSCSGFGGSGGSRLILAEAVPLVDDTGGGIAGTEAGTDDAGQVMS